eukprot:2808211-Rhodomonas_salina.1
MRNQQHLRILSETMSCADQRTDRVASGCVWCMSLNGHFRGLARAGRIYWGVVERATSHSVYIGQYGCGHKLVTVGLRKTKERNRQHQMSFGNGGLTRKGPPPCRCPPRDRCFAAKHERARPRFPPRPLER